MIHVYDNQHRPGCPALPVDLDGWNAQQRLLAAQFAVRVWSVAPESDAGAAHDVAVVQGRMTGSSVLRDAAAELPERERHGERASNGNMPSRKADPAEHDFDGRDLAGRAVMVCEDEVLIAYDIASAIEDAGGEVLGPFATVADALDTLDQTVPDLAVLDVNLLDGDVTPVLEQLVEASVPVVVSTGTGLPETVAAKDVRVFIKPTEPNALVAALTARMD